MITQQYLKTRLRYRPETGFFYWLNGPREGKTAGWLSVRGYMQVSLLGKKHYTHRLAWLYTHGSIPEYLDHINRDKIDNRLANLRPATAQQNACNKVSTNKTTGLPTGVYHNRKRYCAQVMQNKKTICLGTYDTPEEASVVYQAKRLELFGEFSIGL